MNNTYCKHVRTYVRTTSHSHTVTHTVTQQGQMPTNYTMSHLQMPNCAHKHPAALLCNSLRGGNQLKVTEPKLGSGRFPCLTRGGFNCTLGSSMREYAPMEGRWLGYIRNCQMHRSSLTYNAILFVCSLIKFCIFTG